MISLSSHPAAIQQSPNRLGGIPGCPIGQRQLVKVHRGPCDSHRRDWMARIRPVPEPLISLDYERTSPQSGGQAQVIVTVTNPGTVVEGHRLTGSQPRLR